MRSRFAHSLLLVRYSVFIALGGDVRRFSQLILSVSHQGKAAAYVGVAVLRLAHRPVLRLVFSSRLYVHRSLFIRVVASKKRRRFPSPPLASCLTRQILRPLPHSLRSSVSFLVSFLVPSCVSPPVSFSCRIASSPRSHLIPSRRARCAARLPPVLPPRRFVQLVSPFSPCLAALAALAALIAS